jgi:hypothetical protein
MGSKSSKAAAEQASDAAPPASVENIVQSSQPHEENIENDDTAGEPSHEKPAVSQEQAPLSDIEMIVQSGLHEGEEQPEDGPASKSLSGAIPNQHGLSIQQAVQELKEKFSINAPMDSAGQDSLGQIRKEMDAYGVPLPIASIEETTIRKRSASLYVRSYDAVRHLLKQDVFTESQTVHRVLQTLAPSPMAHHHHHPVHL